jgi:hypothetical protein
VSTITAVACPKVKEANKARGFGLHDARHAPLSLSLSERAGNTTAVGLVAPQAKRTRTPYGTREMAHCSDSCQCSVRSTVVDFD